MARVFDDYRGLRQGLLVLRRALYAGAGAQPCSDSILREVRQLAELGILRSAAAGADGQFLQRSDSAQMGFSELLLAVADAPGIRRVRFTTSHPRDFTQDIVDAIDAQPKLCNHVHLPVQSGSTRVLQAMQRTYSREEYLEKIAMIRGAKRSISITTDIIVGFPGEADEDLRGNAEPCLKR